MRMKLPLTRRQLLASLPALGAAGLGLGFARMLHGLNQGRFDPRAINTPLTGGDVPTFAGLPALPGIPGLPGLTPADFQRLEQPVLLLVWASWCLPCLEEIPTLRQLVALQAARREQGRKAAAFWGLCYKDEPAPAARWLARAGQPFTRLGMDPTGRSAIEWGVTGVPESFLILPDARPGARIVWHGTGSLTMTLYQERIRPHLEARP